MIGYKVYRIGHDGLIEETAFVEAGCDDEIIEACIEAQGRARLEIWSGERFVALLREPRPAGSQVRH